MQSKTIEDRAGKGKCSPNYNKGNNRQRKFSQVGVMSREEGKNH